MSIKNHQQIFPKVQLIGMFNLSGLSSMIDPYQEELANIKGQYRHDVDVYTRFYNDGSPPQMDLVEARDLFLRNFEYLYKITERMPNEGDEAFLQRILVNAESKARVAQKEALQIEIDAAWQGWKDHTVVLQQDRGEFKNLDGGEIPLYPSPEHFAPFLAKYSKFSGFSELSEKIPIITLYLDGHGEGETLAGLTPYQVCQITEQAGVSPGLGIFSVCFGASMCILPELVGKLKIAICASGTTLNMLEPLFRVSLSPMSHFLEASEKLPMDFRDEKELAQAMLSPESIPRSYIAIDLEKISEADRALSHLMQHLRGKKHEENNAKKLVRARKNAITPGGKELDLFDVGIFCAELRERNLVEVDREKINRVTETLADSTIARGAMISPEDDPRSAGILFKANFPRG